MLRRALHTHWHEIVADDFAMEIEISYTATPGTPDTWDEPGDAPEFEIQGAVFLSQYGWADFPLSYGECSLIESEIAQRHEFRPYEPDPDDARDRMLDDRMMERAL